MGQSWEVCIANEVIIFYSVRAKAISNLLANDSKRKRAENCLVKPHLSVFANIFHVVSYWLLWCIAY